MEEVYYIIKDESSGCYWSGSAWAKSIKRALHFKNIHTLRNRLIFLNEVMNCKTSVLKYTVKVEQFDIN
jgi:hypothetical protein